MSDINDRLEYLLFEKSEKYKEPEVYSTSQTQPDFVENRKCAKCVGECKIY